MNTTPDIILPAPGAHRNIPEHVYRAWSAVNQSMLKDGETMMHVAYNRDHPKEATDEMKLGTQVDMALTEPARFLESHVVAPKFDRRTKDGKAGAAQWEIDNQGKVSVTQDELDQIQGMAKALREHAGAAKMFSDAGDLQLSLLWKDEKTGLMCKARLDRLSLARPFIIDLKTTSRSAGANQFARTVMDFGYHRQAAWYLDGAEACGLDVTNFIMVVVEQNAPHGVAVYDLGAASIELGRIKNRDALDAYAASLKSGVWPGFDRRVQPLEVPAWALRGIDVTSTFEVIA